MDNNSVNKTKLPDAVDFNEFSVIYMNEKGIFVDPEEDFDDISDGSEIPVDKLHEFFTRNIVKPKRCTDVFIWVHGWRNDLDDALESARKIFNGINLLYKKQQTSYQKIEDFVPAFVVVRWPSRSSVLSAGYKKIRDRAEYMISNGQAEYFLSSLLGYLESINSRNPDKTLRSAAGFYVHCLGHSFGGRFLTAAVTSAATPNPGMTLRGDGANGFPFAVDSMLVFQMAAPCKKFSNELTELVHNAPLKSPLVTTFSSYDKACCGWHVDMEKEQAISTGSQAPAWEPLLFQAPACLGLGSRASKAAFPSRSLGTSRNPGHGR